ncbi:MAG: hypothetical protein CVU95_00805 [Firmicutes bacterium HGW-Firmicutes-2]|jgi:hypothetical protein|nr:MAG: hypothetical protein CVU95_00805 [Firmicutes bacterium HGW-Firmicutes-2]
MNISTGKIESAQKVVVYGPEGIGKSTFASKFPDPLFIDTEGSTKHMDVRRTDKHKPSSWTMLFEQAKYVKNNPTICKTLVIDTADWAEKLCSEYVCSSAQKKSIADFGYGNGFVYLEEAFGKLLNLLEEVIDVGINVVVTAHAQMRKFEQPDELGSYDRWELKLQKKTAPLLKEWADAVLFVNYKTYVVNVDGQGVQKGKNKAQGGKRVMYSTHHVSWDAKNRWGLQEELPFEFESISDHIPSCSTIKSNEPVKQVEPVATPSNVVQEVKVADSPQGIEVIPQSNTDAPEGVPKPLWDMMTAHNVEESEIQEAVASRGYYPKETPIANYDPQFISGVLIGAWDKVYELIKVIQQRNGKFVPVGDEKMPWDN